MFKFPKTKEEAVGFFGNLLWWVSRLQLLAIAIGSVCTIALQLLVGFWDFRGGHQAIIRAHYQETLEAHNAFQRQLERFNSVFEGNPVLGTGGAYKLTEKTFSSVQEITQATTYAAAAQAYIREINEISRLLPNTESELGNYIDAISALNRYYSVTEPPVVGSIEWVNFYGQFRGDLDHFFNTRDAYLEELANEVGSYWRAVRNS